MHRKNAHFYLGFLHCLSFILPPAANSSSSTQVNEPNQVESLTVKKFSMLTEGTSLFFLPGKNGGNGT